MGADAARDGAEHGRAGIDDSVVRDNRVEASATTGSAAAKGSGIYNVGLLRLGDTLVRKNIASAHGLGGAARGGGVWSSPIPDGPPEVGLELEGSAVTTNAVTATSGITPEGGGIYTATVVADTSERRVGTTPLISASRADGAGAGMAARWATSDVKS